MKLNLAGGTYTERSLPLDAQRCINLYPINDKTGAEKTALYGTPGLSLFSTAGLGAIRGCFAAANDRAFVVSGSELYELDSSGAATSRGSLLTSAGICTLEDNGFQLAICDQQSLYIFTYLTNVLVQVTDPDLPSSVGSVDFIDGYFIINENGTGKFYISATYDGLSWSALDFASAESSPDELKRVINFVGYAGLFGAKTLEIWRNTGDSVFPFSRISSATQIGTISPFTVLSIDTSVFWVGSNDQGNGIVYKASGLTPTRISTNAIELILQRVADPSQLRSWTYQKDGHVFYVITGSDLETSLVYDISTELWHERAYLNSDGTYGQHLATCAMYAFGKTLVGSRIDGKVYELTPDIYSDNEDTIKRVRVLTHLVDELKRVRYNTLTLLVETGVGLQSGQGSAPVISLRVSKDGARTWSDYITTEIGAAGKYQTEVNFRRLGIAQEMTFEISISDPVKVSWIGAYLS